MSKPAPQPARRQTRTQVTKQRRPRQRDDEPIGPPSNAKRLRRFFETV